MIRIIRVTLLAALSFVVIAVPGAFAQSHGDDDWQHGTTLGVAIGASSSGDRVEVAMGAAIGWELTPRVAVEAHGSWLDAGRGASQFAATLGTKLSLTPSRAVALFVSAGVGMFRASFDSVAAPAEFYRRRMGSGGSTEGGSHIFQDVVIAPGTGAEIFLTRHMSLRPEVTFYLVTTRSDVHVVPIYGLQFGYHFESHHIVRSQIAPRERKAVASGAQGTPTDSEE